jgi:hypothetical protein
MKHYSGIDNTSAPLITTSLPILHIYPLVYRPHTIPPTGKPHDLKGIGRGGGAEGKYSHHEKLPKFIVYCIILTIDMNQYLFPIIIVLIFCASCGCIYSQPSSDRNTTTLAPTFTILPTISSSDIPVYVSPTSTAPYSDVLVKCPQENNGSLTILGGKPFSYQGFADRGNISMTRYWIFGDSYASYGTIPVLPDKSFNFTLNGEQTSAMINGTYRILFEYPSSDNTYDIKIGYTGKKNDTLLYDRSGNRIINFQDVTSNYLKGTDAANIVEQEIRKSSKDGVNNLTLVVQQPVINFNPVKAHYIGDIISFGGTTNLPPGEWITLHIISSSFIPCEKYPSCNNGDSVRPCCGGLSQTVEVRSIGCGINTWSGDDVNTSLHQFEPESYIIEGYDSNLSVSDNRIFDMMEKPKS